MTFWFQNFSVSRLLPIFRGFNIGFQGTFNCGILVSLIGGSGDPRRKWEEMGEREREREGGREKSVVFVCKRIRKNHRNARSVNIAFPKK